MSIRIYNTAPGGSGGAPTLQAVLNAGHIASTGAGVAAIALENGTDTNGMTPTSNVISDSSGNFTEQSFTQFLAQSNGPVSVQVTSDKIVFTAVGSSFTIDFTSGSPVITYELLSGDNTQLLFVPPTTNNVKQAFKNQSGNIALDPTVNPQTGTTYTFALQDAFGSISGNNAATQTWTIPANATVPLPIGCLIDGLAIGAGKITVAAAAGVTLNSASGNFSSAQWAGFSLWQYAANSWVMIGNLIA